MECPLNLVSIRKSLRVNGEGSEGSVDKGQIGLALEFKIVAICAIKVVNSSNIKCEFFKI